MNPPPHNPLDRLLGYQLRRASAALMASLARALGAIGLTPTEASVLLLIAANPGITQSEIGRMLGIQRANMAPLTGALDRRGLIARERVDGRSHGLAASEAGMALATSARTVMERHDADTTGALPAELRERIRDAIAALRPGEEERDRQDEAGPSSS